MNVTFSVIIPTYNRGYILWKTISGVQKQVYPYWELLVIDDGSTDNTQMVVAEFQKDPRIKYIKMPHLGGQAARNEGLKLANGSIIASVDSDDYIYDTFLSTALEYFQNNPKKIFATSNHNRRIEQYGKNYQLLKLIESSSVQKHKVSLEDYFNFNIEPCGTGIFIRRSAIQEGIRWDENIKIFQDWDLILQLGNKYQTGYMNIPVVLFEYCRRFGIDGITSRANYLDWANGFEAIYQKHKNDPLIKNQQWYPKYVNEYKALRIKNISGKTPFAIYRHFLSEK